VNLKAWVPFCLLWITCVYCVDAFLIWGGGFFAQHGAVDFSGGYVIHLSAGVAGFVAAAVIGPRLQRDREIDAPNNVAMLAVGAGLLWLGWNGFNGGDPYASNMSAAAAVLNTNLCTAVAFLVWVGWDYLTGRKPGLISGVNGMITGLVAITPAAGYVNGFGAIALGVIASTIVYFALNYLSRLRPFRNVDDTLGVIYTHGAAGLSGGLLTGIFADPQMALGYKTSSHGLVATGTATGLIHGNWNLLKWQVLAALFVICWTGVITFVLLRLVGLFIPLRMAEKNMEEGDIAEHGHEVYPSDVPSLGYPNGMPGVATGATDAEPAPA
jgi:Amt family ammonium transporter